MSQKERQFRERMLKEEVEADRQFEREQKELRRYEDKVERLSEAADQALDKAMRTRNDTDRRRAELAQARAYVYRDFKFDSSGYDCPPQAPIKGNEPWESSALIYHLPGWAFYGATIPEWCFETQQQARKFGFRPSKIRR